jgi:hypothetical protein
MKMKTPSKLSARKGKNLEFSLEDLKIKRGKARSTLGGTAGTGHAKRARPLAPRSTYHVVLRSEKARGPYNMLSKVHKQRVKKVVYAQARRFFVRIEGYANVGNHLHIKAYAQAPTEFRNFLRTVTCLIARKVTGATRGNKFGRFWDGLVFTRILRSFAEHEILQRYIFANILQADCGPGARKGYLELWYRPDPGRLVTS